jgi:1-pyrroline-5-carboxylate dehydrogenase
MCYLDPSPHGKETIMLPPFRNEPLTDFSDERNAASLREAIAQVESRFGQEYPIVIGGKRYTTGDMLASPNPSNHEEIVGLIHKATTDLADKAIEEATQAFREWKHVAPEVRARYLLRVAALLKRRKAEFTALMVLGWARAGPKRTQTLPKRLISQSSTPGR